MAFNASGAGRSAGGAASDIQSTLVQRIRSLQGTCDNIAAASAQLGSPTDSLALRNKLLGLHTLAQRTEDEIEPTLLKLRGELQGKAGGSASSLRRLEDEYSDIKSRVAEAVGESQRRSKAIKLRAPAPVPEADASGSLKRRAGAGSSGGGGAGSEQAVVVDNMLRKATDADVHLAAVSCTEAAACFTRAA